MRAGWHGVKSRADAMWCPGACANVVQRTERSALFEADWSGYRQYQPGMQMKRDYAGYPYLSPFLLWSDLAAKTMEMMLASAQVIGHRTGRMALAGPAPNARDRREFTVMGLEKIEASTQSARAMAAHMMTMNQAWGALAFRHLLQNASAFMSLAGSRTPDELIARQAALARALEQSAIGIAEVSKNATKLAHRGLKPIHARATANARRLGKR